MSSSSPSSRGSGVEIDAYLALHIHNDHRSSMTQCYEVLSKRRIWWDSEVDDSRSDQTNLTSMGVTKSNSDARVKKEAMDDDEGVVVVSQVAKR